MIHKIAIENTLAVNRYVHEIIAIHSEAQLVATIQSAARDGRPIYPVSTGRNWGYNGRSPFQSGGILLDLSPMNKILEYDKESGVITLEPGVTQQQLFLFLKKNGDRHVVPTTGAGPHCSLVGNALERGFGLTPYADHFSAVLALRAVLANGKIYESPFSSIFKDRQSVFKWGLGPYIDGLFSQSNLGVVTHLTLALAPRPERVAMFYFSVPKSVSIGEVSDEVRDILRDYPSVVAGFNLMDGLRIQAVTSNLSLDKIAPWTGIGILWGETALVEVAFKRVRKRLKKFSTGVSLLDERRLRVFNRLFDWIPALKRLPAYQQFKNAEQGFQILSGYPNEMALRLIYWKGDKHKVLVEPINPDLEGTGLIWYAPIIPANSTSVEATVKMVRRVCGKFGVDPLITFTSINSLYFELTLPLLFDRSSSEKIERAQTCFAELVREGKVLGIYPYRLGLLSASWPDESGIYSAIKKAIDPENMISPGKF